MRRATVLCFFLFLAGVVMGLAQLWLHPWSDELFLRLIVTDGAILIVCLAALFLVREHRETERIRKGGRLD